MNAEVQNRPAENQYALVEGDATVGFAAYEIVGDEIRFTHTEIEPSRRSADSAPSSRRAPSTTSGELRATRRAACPFVVDFIDDHVDYRELLTR
nr:hypothetical protein GCM10025699_77740 [Microbacterium flavescens]